MISPARDQSYRFSSVGAVSVTSSPEKSRGRRRAGRRPRPCGYQPDWPRHRERSPLGVPIPRHRAHAIMLLNPPEGRPHQRTSAVRSGPRCAASRGCWLGSGRWESSWATMIAGSFSLWQTEEHPRARRLRLDRGAVATSAPVWLQSRARRWTWSSSKRKTWRGLEAPAGEAINCAQEGERSDGSFRGRAVGQASVSTRATVRAALDRTRAGAKSRQT